MTTSLLLASALVLTAPFLRAQETRACLCTAPGTETLGKPDTVFHVVEHFDAAFCGHIDRSATPFVYRDFTLRSCGYVRVPLRTPLTHGAHIHVTGGMLAVDELLALPTGPDMSLVPRPCWRTYHVLRENEDTTKYAINAMKQLIAELPKPTAGQMARIDARLDALPPAIYWTDQELLGQVFLCAVFDAAWYSMFTELRETYRFGGTMADYYDDLLEILHNKQAGRTE